MDSDDDRRTMPLSEDHSPRRRLKRSKKSKPKSPEHLSFDTIEDPLLFPQVDFARLEALENDTDALDLIDSVSSEDSLTSSQESPSQGNENPNEVENVATKLDEEVDKSNVAARSGGSVAGDAERSEDEKERRKEKSAKGCGDESNKATNKRREEKERKAYLKELHVESQRLLRETRGAAFKPIPVVQKPISSVLEKIRKRKLEISKKAMTETGRHSIFYEENNSARIKLMDTGVPNKDERIENVTEVVENKMDAMSYHESRGEASKMAEPEDASEETVNGKFGNNLPLPEEPMPAFRKPVDDTQDLFIDSNSNGGDIEQHDEQMSSPLDECLAPSSVAVNLKFDSAPLFESSSDEDDNNERSFDPRPPKGDRMKDFVDDEAEVENDSDDDANLFNDEEDEDSEDLEELNNMIATECEDGPVDKERRDELHQKWLEQQDAAGTDSLLQKLKCGPQLKDALLQGEEPKSDGDDDDNGEDDDDDESMEGEPVPKNFTRVTTKMAKQMILQLLPDNEEAYVSDGGEDDDARSKHAHGLHIRKGQQDSILSPAEDASSREVFGLIRKMNREPEKKRKPKPSSFFDSLLKGGNNSSSKSSFIGRPSKHHFSSSHKQGPAVVRSFIFGRDDSNSRSSSISMSEDSSDTVSLEVKQTKNATAKFCSSSQTKSIGIRTRGDDTETASRTSLLDILKGKSSKPQASCKDIISSADLKKPIFAFRDPTKKIHGGRG